jgi:membrane-bound metal-dependent hydrolase YbcI (DUF457 family)
VPSDATIDTLTTALMIFFLIAFSPFKVIEYTIPDFIMYIFYNIFTRKAIKILHKFYIEFLVILPNKLPGNPAIMLRITIHSVENSGKSGYFLLHILCVQITYDSDKKEAVRFRISSFSVNP